MDISKAKSLIPSKIELLVFGGGIFMGAVDRAIESKIDMGDISMLEFYTNGLPASMVASLTAYGVSENISKGIRTGVPLYAGYLVGQALTQITRQYLQT